MSKRKKQKCTHPHCIGGFIYVTSKIEGANPGEVTMRSLCPVCCGLAQVRRKPKSALIQP
jgi:hypothetical protein